jgi:hypothetical protein
MKIEMDWTIFWTAVGSIAALFTLILALLQTTRMKYLRLQRIQNKERSFYDSVHRAPINPEPDSVEAKTQGYLESVDRSLRGLKILPDTERQQAREKLKILISNLRATHETLVTVLEPFSTTDVKKFFEEFDSLNSKFSTLYYGGRIAHDARTHCSDVEQIVNDLSTMINSNNPGWQDISALRYSVVVQDREVIVPIMTSILDRTQLELSLIALAISAKDKSKAIWLKERYWFDVKFLYQTIISALKAMSELTNKL